MLDAAFAAAICAGWFVVGGALLIAVGVPDLLLALSKRKTVSWYVWRRSGKARDYAILAGQVAVVFLFRGYAIAVVYTLGVIAGHSRWQVDGGPDA